MTLAPDVRALRVDLLKGKLSRELIVRGLTPSVADEIVDSGTYNATTNGSLVVDFTEGRATENPDDIARMAERLSARAAPPPRTLPPHIAPEQRHASLVRDAF